MRRILLIIVTVLITVSIWTGIVTAQDTDISAMDREQLMLLLQQIMQRLESGEGEAAADPAAEAGNPVPDVLPITIHQNKRLFIGDMPDYYFFRAPAAGDDDEGSPDGGKKPGPKKTPEECENYCAYEACSWGDIKCYWYCYFPCLGQPIPDDYLDKG